MRNTKKHPAIVRVLFCVTIKGLYAQRIFFEETFRFKNEGYAERI